jgi:hypothetical protein
MKKILEVEARVKEKDSIKEDNMKKQIKDFPLKQFDQS